MNDLQALKLSDNFDVWRDLINKAISHVNGLHDVPKMDSNTSGYLITNKLNSDGEYVLEWVDLVKMLNDLGINTGGGNNTEFPTVGSYLPNGLTAGTTGYIYLRPNGVIENSNDIINRGNITSDNTITGYKIVSTTSLNSHNLELGKGNKSGEPSYIDFNYPNTNVDYTSQIKEIAESVLSINGNTFSELQGSNILSPLSISTSKNKVTLSIVNNNDFSVITTTETDAPFKINLSTGNVTIKNALSANSISCATSLVSNTLKSKGNTEVGGSLIVSGNETIKGNSTITNNLTVDGKLIVNELIPNKLTLDATHLSLAPNIHSGAGSSFVSDLYINSASNSLIIRNDASNVYLLVSSSVNGASNSLRPFSFNMSSGLVSMNNGATISSLSVTNNTTIGGKLTVSNDISATGTITGNRVYNAVFNDYAEFFEKGEETEVGDIISLDIDSNEERYVKATNPRLVVGVHSDTYGHILGGLESIENSEDSFIPVGMTGRVKTKIIGAIEKGDEVVLSKIPGVGRKYHPLIDNERDIIGFVVETNLSEDIKLVKMKI